MKDIQKRFGNNVRILRKHKGISQETLAFKCGLHRTYVSDVERGSRNISLINIEKIAKALSVSIKELFD
jgi:transcriptional regulator with XRE-family HTH domain